MLFYKHQFRDLIEQWDALQDGSHVVHLLPTSWHLEIIVFSLLSFPSPLPFLSSLLFVVLRTEHNSLNMPVESFTMEAPSIPSILHTFYTEMGVSWPDWTWTLFAVKLTGTCDFPVFCIILPGSLSDVRRTPGSAISSPTFSFHSASFPAINTI